MQRILAIATAALALAACGGNDTGSAATDSAASVAPAATDTAAPTVTATPTDTTGGTGMPADTMRRDSTMPPRDSTTTPPGRP